MYPGLASVWAFLPTREEQAQLLKQLAAAPKEQVRPGAFVRRVVIKGVTFQRQWLECQDCAWVHPTMFMVHDALWKQAGCAEEDYLCMGCFEKRLGRKVTRADLKEVPLNRVWKVELSSSP